MKNIKNVSVLMLFIALCFGACLKKEDVGLQVSPLDPLVNSRVELFKIDSVSAVADVGGTSSVTVHYSHIYETLPEETRKRIGGTVIVTPQRALFLRIDQKQIVFPQLGSGTVLKLGLGFYLAQTQEISRLVAYNVTVR
jgi:hypothetical protein